MVGMTGFEPVHSVFWKILSQSQKVEFFPLYRLFWLLLFDCFFLFFGTYFYNITQKDYTKITRKKGA